MVDEKSIKAPKSKSSDDSRIIMQTVEDEMKKSYLDYAMSVIIGRALPDVRDGLKPVHRRILYAMNELSNTYNKPYKKCARIVGEVLGKYHPHGDLAVYDSLVRMAQEFSLRYPLIQGQGNFGSVDGDSAAAMRYCVTGDTLILTDEGILPIKELSNKMEEKISIGIASMNNSKNHASKFFNSGRQKIIEVNTKSGFRIRGSDNHPLLCWMMVNGVPCVEWKLLNDLKKGDVVVLDRISQLFSKKDLDLKKYNIKSSTRNKEVHIPEVMDEDIAFLLGALVSEGSFHQKKILFTNSDTDFYTRIKSILNTKFGGIKLYERNIKGKCFELDLYHQDAVNFLENIGLNNVKSEDKEIPFSILRSSKNCVASFLKALFEGDGSIVYHKDKRHSGSSIELAYISKSKKLIDQLKIVLINFGILTTAPTIDKRNGCFKLNITGYRNISRFNEEIGFFSYRKKQALANIKKLNDSRMSKTDYIPLLNDYLRNKYLFENKIFFSKNNFDRFNNLEKNFAKLSKIIDTKDIALINKILKNQYVFNNIKSISKLSAKEEVYSIKVDSTCHSFVANGFINHNTEARLAKISDEMLQDIDKETVDFIPNFDGTLKEPIVMPSKFPNLFINGSSGIAVGMATNIPPHNISEMCNAVIEIIDNPDISTEDLLQTVKGPDFPTGAEIIGRRGIIDAYNTGRGGIRIRSVIDIEEKKDRKRLVVKEIPYQVNKAQLVEAIAELVKDKKIPDISDLRDESDRDGVRIVIELKRDANPEIVKNMLYNYSRLEDSFGINIVAIVNNEPKLLSLKLYLRHYADHRIDVVRKRCVFDLRKAEERAHILEGLKIALKNIDDVIAILKSSRSADEDAKETLMDRYKLSVAQCDAILEMKIRRLAMLEQEKINTEYSALQLQITDLKDILSSDTRVRNIIKNEMTDIIHTFGKNDTRKTKIIDAPDEEIDYEMEDLIPDEPVVITLSHSGYIKRLPIETYKVQNRGGRGVIASDVKEDDYIEKLFVARTHSSLLIITNKGQLYWLKVYKVPDASRQSMGKAIVNLLELDADEKVNAIIPVKDFDDKHFLVMATKFGTIKKTNLIEFANPRKGGIAAINLDDTIQDKLINVVMTDGKQDIMLATHKGVASRFSEEDVRATGRTSQGVRGIRLEENDFVVGMIIAENTHQVLTLTENGYGKKTDMTEYRKINRGGKGVINIICSERNGNVAGILPVIDTDEILLISRKGILIRTTCDQISTVGRNTQGVKVMKLGANDKLVNMTKIMKE